MKLSTPELLILTQMCTKSFVGWGFATDPTGGASSAPPDPLAALRGPTSKGRGWEEWGGGREGREGWGGERKAWEGREGRGQATQNYGSRTAPVYLEAWGLSPPPNVGSPEL